MIVLVQESPDQGSSGRRRPRRPRSLKLLCPSLIYLKSSRTSEFLSVAFMVGVQTFEIQNRSVRIQGIWKSRTARTCIFPWVVRLSPMSTERKKNVKDELEPITSSCIFMFWGFISYSTLYHSWSEKSNSNSQNRDSVFIVAINYHAL